MSTLVEDYNKFKARKSVTTDSEKRSAFLQALKASPYIKIFKCSTADEKQCQFTEKLKDTKDSFEGDFSLIQPVENNPSTSNGLPSEIFAPLADYFETFRDLGSYLLESNGESTSGLEHSSVPCNGSSPPANSAEDANRFQDSSVISNDINTFAPSVQEQASVIPMETEPVVPCIHIPETDFPHGSLYGACNELDFLSGNSQTTSNTHGEGCSVDLSETQLSPDLCMGEECPPDYDPAEDLIHSREPQQNLAGNQLEINPETQSSICEILSIQEVEIVGNHVYILNPVEMSPTNSPDSPKYYLLKISNVTEKR